MSNPFGNEMARAARSIGMGPVSETLKSSDISLSKDLIINSLRSEV